MDASDTPEHPEHRSFVKLSKYRIDASVILLYEQFNSVRLTSRFIESSVTPQHAQFNFVNLVKLYMTVSVMLKQLGHSSSVKLTSCGNMPVIFSSKKHSNRVIY
jgi:hypothetical protein